MAVNEFGAKLDRNGYAPSIIGGHDAHTCWRCGRNGYRDHLDRHEVFGGGLREKSKKYGLWVHLCHERCHQGQNGVHRVPLFAAELKACAQEAAMRVYGWDIEGFRRRFRNNYIDEEEKK